MLKLNKDSQRIPHGGHHYVECGVTFRGDTFKEVVQKLSDFRITNNIPIGFPEQEILLFYAAHWPWLVREDREHKAEDPLSPHYVGWREWIFKTWKTPPSKFVTKREAQERAKICADCPYNRKLDCNPSAEFTELKRKSFILSRGIGISEDLGYCSLHGADLPVFVQADPPKGFSSKKSNETRPGCWAD